MRGGPNGAARRLQANDLFGMAELTGDAPLGDLAPASSKPPPPPPPAPAAARPSPKPTPNFDDIDIEVGNAPAPPPLPSRPPAPPKSTRPPPPPKADFSGDDLSLSEEAPAPPRLPPAQGDEGNGEEDASFELGGLETGPLKDPFEGMNLGEPGTGAIDLATQPKKDKLAEAVRAEMLAEEPPAPAPEVPPGRDMVSSALTGLVGAALAIAVVIVAALSDDASAGWLGLTPASDVVATRVVSGLYDTASGKPVFYIRGRIENRGKKVRGPVRVTAELVSDGAAEVKAEAIAGAEPSPEEVWSLRNAADADKLTRALQVTQMERKLQPGTSLPFFAVIPDPPADLQRHRLHVKVESVDAWVPPAPRAGKGR